MESDIAKFGAPRRGQDMPPDSILLPRAGSSLEQSMQQAEVHSLLGERRTVGFSPPSINLYEDYPWDGGIGGGFGRQAVALSEPFQYERRDPLHALSVIRDMMVQFSMENAIVGAQPYTGIPDYSTSLQSYMGIPQSGNNPQSYGGDSGGRYRGPFGAAAEQDPWPHPFCLIHGFHCSSYIYKGDAKDARKPLSEAEVAQMDPIKIQYVQKHLRALLHARTCDHSETAPGGPPFGYCAKHQCKTTKMLIKHMKSCKNVEDCSFPECLISWRVIIHYGKCRRPSCAVCKPFIKTAQPNTNKNWPPPNNFA